MIPASAPLRLLEIVKDTSSMPSQKAQSSAFGRPLMKKWGRALAALCCATLLTGCERIWDIFVEWSGIFEQHPESVCIISTPPVIMSLNIDDSLNDNDAYVFSREFDHVIRSYLTRKAGEIGDSDHRYFIIPTGTVKAPERDCLMSGGSVNPNSDYRACIVAWGNIVREREASRICHPKPSFFSTGIEISKYKEDKKVTVSSMLVNLNSETANQPRKPFFAEVPWDDLGNLSKTEWVATIAQRAGMITARQIEDEARKIQTDR